MPAGRPLQYETPEEMQEIIDRYFDACLIRRKEMAGIELSEEEIELCSITHDEHPTVSGIALVLDLNRKTLLDYQGREEFHPTVKKAKARVEGYVEQRLHNQACTGMIFSLKNNFGWKDKKETEMSGSVGITDLTNEELDAKLSGLMNAATKPD
jgi:hypothetical protein